ncbi:leucine-rich repeat domain-containing protein [Candidatus Dependentiae bacterium]|nr:leucine-rich repeat domain-containing protein [Candidatus Dependentiae bacterium]
MNSAIKLIMPLCFSLSLNAMEFKTESVGDIPFARAAQQILCLKLAKYPLYKGTQQERETLECRERGLRDKDELERYVKQVATALALDANFKKPTDSDLKQFPVRYLELEGNELADLPESLGDLAGELTSLDISCNQFEKFPAIVSKLTSLTDLNIANFDLELQKDNLKALTNLTRLTLSSKMQNQFDASNLPFVNYEKSKEEVSDWRNTCHGNMRYVTYKKNINSKK